MLNITEENKLCFQHVGYMYNEIYQNKTSVVSLLIIAEQHRIKQKSFHDIAE